MLLIFIILEFLALSLFRHCGSTVFAYFSVFDAWCFIKRHPFTLFHNSLKWWLIYVKFLPNVAEEMLIQHILTKYGYQLKLLGYSWCNADVIMCREYKLACCNWCWHTCWIAALLRRWTSSGSLMTDCWNFTIAAIKMLKRSLLHTCGDRLTFTPFSDTVHQRTPLARWLGFWITKHLVLCFHVA